MISLIDVISSIDAKGKPIGHGLKVLMDFRRFFNKPVQILAGREYVEVLGTGGCALPYSIKSGDKRLVHIKIFINYLYSLRMAKGDILVYTIINEALLWYIALLKGSKKVIIVTYENWDLYIEKNLQKNMLRKFLVKRGLKRVDGCIVTNRTYKPNGKYMRVSDYYCTAEIEQLGKTEKKYGCVCLGEMRYGKDVCGLTKVMGKTDIPLLIAGAFQSKQLYYSTKLYQSKNIAIINRNLSYEEYMRYLSGFKYVVLPYDAEYYDGRTSGVLLEGIFVGAIPIAPKTLLEQNGISGLGYSKLSEIPFLIKAYENGEIIIENSLERFEYEYISKEIRRFFQTLNPKAKKGWKDEIEF